ncbi:MAG: DUF3352 domain-containing protein [Acidimicrobiales bacterium]
MRRWTVVTMLVAGAGLLALPGCGGKTDEKARAAGITPTDAVAFFSVNLSPSIEQQRNLKGIVEKFPGAAEEVKGDFEDARDRLLDDVTEEAGLDFKTDVKPWLGNEVALAVLPPAAGQSLADGDDPPVVLMFETDDAAKATAAMKKSAAEGHFDGQSRVIGDFLVAASSADDDIEMDSLDQVSAAAKADKGGLAKNAKFTSVVDDLAGDRLLLAWADGEALAEMSGGALGSVLPPGLLGDGAGFAAADVHAEKSALVLRGVATVTGEGGGGEPVLTEGVPDSVLGALTLFDLASGARQALSALAGLGGGFDLDDLTAGIGIDIEDDVLSWMEGEVVLVAGPAPSGGGIPDFAVIVEPTDQTKAEAGVDKIAAALDDQGFTLDRREVAGAEAFVAPAEFEGVQPAMALFADRFILATNVEFLETLATKASKSLGASDAYKSVIGQGSRSATSFQLVLRIDPIREAIEAVFPSGGLADYEREAKSNVEPLNTFGLFSRRDGDRHRFEMRLTVD